MIIFQPSGQRGRVPRKVSIVEAARLLVFVPEASQVGKQVVIKSARPIDIVVNPAVKPYYVELTLEADFQQQLMDAIYLLCVSRSEQIYDNRYICMTKEV